MVGTQLLDRRKFIGAALAAPVLLAWPGIAQAATPQRIVSMDLLLTELLLTLGIQPVAIANIPLYRRLVAEPVLSDKVADIGPLNEPSLEYLQILKPDLLLMADWQTSGLDNLNGITDVLPLAVFPKNMPAVAFVQSLLRQLADLLGRQKNAETAIAACEQAIANARETLSGLRRPVYVCRFTRDGRNAAVFGGNGMIGNTLARLGLRNAFTGRVNGSGVASVSLRRLADVPDAIIIHFDRGTETDRALERLADSPLWNAFPAVREGRVVRMPVIYPNGGVRSVERLATQLASGLARVKNV
ncbi:ABC transporter substrate-binding protein [Rhizobium sp. CFBP 8762]|uniref:ABC transporter substrate-binding protein n=1 Tax=Rhizobium sp. CFBP 8762 TaxID=2775279 RepID=UPI00178611AD|nr:ABC transporter substrate-binding protein [Rhizobium sp. CFBP 8762]MBD8554994.1 ABC transporter substrate-binding protein [Rhizobium sp. CFBP 8762]